MNKTFANANEAIFDMADGAVIMSGGFGLCGNPENLIDAVSAKGVNGLTVISNNCGVDTKGLGILLQARQIRKMISSYVGENKEFERQFLSGELEVDLVPQGTLAERIRAGGAGIRAFFTPTGVGTVVADDKEVRDFDGVPCVLETGLVADFAYPMMATAAKVTIAEVEELVPAGELDPNTIHTPGVFVQRVLLGVGHEKPIEQRTTRPRPS